MKKCLIIALMGFAMTTLCGCGEKKSGSNTITGENGKEYANYREACRDGDFDVAHKFLDKLKEEATWDSEIVQEAENYIFDYEVNTLISQNTEEANTRVVYLLNEIPIRGTKCSIGELIHDSEESDYGRSCSMFNIKCNKILELAISLKNQNMAKKILPLFKEDEIVDFYTVKAYSYDTRDAAQKKYDNAVAEELFND